MATDWLKKLRTENFPSQTALALAAGIKPARYSRIENGYCDMREEEVEGLAKALKMSADEVRGGQPGSAKPKVAKVPPSKGVSAAIAAKTPTMKPPPAPPASLPHKTIHFTEAKSGDDLTDPKNFALMPPVELLSPHNLSNGDVRAQLQKAIVFAEKVLHTSKVRPAVWVAWRDFSRDAQKFLRGPAPAAAPAEPTPKPIIKPQIQNPKPLPAKAALVKIPDGKPKPRLNGNKNIFGHFVDVARESLPAATSAALNEKALAAKTSHPEMGFMKHFKRIAEIELPRPEFERIEREASQRDSPTG